MTMNINLTPQLEELVRQKVSSGLYNSASEVAREELASGLRSFPVRRYVVFYCPLVDGIEVVRVPRAIQDRAGGPVSLVASGVLRSVWNLSDCSWALTSGRPVPRPSRPVYPGG